MTHLVHHLGVFASDLATSRAVYVAALASLGVMVGHPADDVCELWREGADNAAWTYRHPSLLARRIQNRVAFYPSVEVREVS